MKFKITRHSGFSAPPDALDQLFERLPGSTDEVSFAKASNGITATWNEEGPISRTEEERATIGRLEVLDVVLATCKQHAPELRSDWYAVSILR